jgi:predicted thioesterase
MKRMVACRAERIGGARAVATHARQGTAVALDLPAELKPGLSGTAEIVVGTRDTAPHVGSGKIGVLATPIMVNLMEAAALQAVERFMPDGFQTVGTHLDVRHFAATPVGMTVRARAELLGVAGRTLTFRLQAADDREPIGEGVHERLIINVERFDARMQKKLKGGAAG